MESDKPVRNKSEYVNTSRATLIIYFSGYYMISIYPIVSIQFLLFSFQCYVTKFTISPNVFVVSN